VGISKPLIFKMSTQLQSPIITGYELFSDEYGRDLRNDHPNFDETVHTRMTDTMWSSLCDEIKDDYENRASLLSAEIHERKARTNDQYLCSKAPIVSFDDTFIIPENFRVAGYELFVREYREYLHVNHPDLSAREKMCLTINLWKKLSTIQQEEYKCRASKIAMRQCKYKNRRNGEVCLRPTWPDRAYCTLHGRY